MIRLRTCENKGRKKLFSVLLALFVVVAVFVVTIVLFGFIERRLYPIKYSLYVKYYAEEYGLPEEIVYAVILTESKFNENALSHAGACGLMQLMPSTYKSVAEELERIPDINLIFEPSVNICCGSYLLSKLYNKYGVWEIVYAAYNAGESAVDRWLSDDRYSKNGELIKIPYSETSGYVKKVSGAAEAYKKIYGF